MIPNIFYLGFHKIFIVHDEGHGKHRCWVYHGKIVWGQDHVPSFFCTWHVLKAWRLHSMETTKDSKVRRAILDHLHMVMFMSINLDETIDDFKTHGRRWWWKVLIIYNLVLFGQNIFFGLLFPIW